MKREHPIRTLLGLKQEDIAMLLGVNRGQWSMYEIGKRDLPLPAKQLLGEILMYLKLNETASKDAEPIVQHSQKQLEFQLREIEYRQRIAERKIAAATLKLQQQQRMQQLGAFLENRKADKKNVLPFADAMIRRAAAGIDATIVTLIMAEQHKQEMLGLEKLIVEAKLQHVVKTNDAEGKV